MAFNQDIVKLAKANTYFREVLATGPKTQVVVMSIPPGGEIGSEVHPDVDQVLVFVQGEGQAILDGEKSAVSVDRLVQVSAGTR
ncbi:MAG TPA: cupin domain-containing protein, partial [Candidatus Limnocylindrales bacterium]|nr:cupin domain-containing protein [Candidatus Limnocylindrales bacterium]